MELLIGFLAFIGILLQVCSSLLALNDLSPPPGNSLSMKVKTRNGKQVFSCVKGKWKLSNADAFLVESGNPDALAGSYRHQSDESTWSLFNSPEQYAEAGFSTSEVSGTRIAAQEGNADSPNVLMEASSHKYMGKASLISYIQGFFSKSKAVLHRGGCNASSAEAGLEAEFEAEFWLWSQDTVPPTATPAPLSAGQGWRLLGGMFAEGVVPYAFQDGRWARREWSATLYDVPGGAVVGKHYAESNGSSLVWQVFEPNGWGARAVPACEPVEVAGNCLPWSLHLVTDRWGHSSITRVQMLSTRGGAAPPAAPRAGSASGPIMPSESKPAAGDVHQSAFSAIFWFYA